MADDSIRSGDGETGRPSADATDRSDLPDAEKVADRLEDISRRLDRELTSNEQGWLNAADHYLRTVDTETAQRGDQP